MTSRSPLPDSRDTQNDHFLALVTESARHTLGSPQRRAVIARLFNDLNQTGRIFWPRKPPDFSLEGHQDLLQETQLRVIDGLNRKVAEYDPSLANVVTWVNQQVKYVYLEQRRLWFKRRSDDLLRHQGMEQIYTDALLSQDRGLVDETWERWQAAIPLIRPMVENDPEGLLRAKHLRDRPDINLQLLAQTRLAQESFQGLAARLGSKTSSIHSLWNRNQAYLQQTLRHYLNLPDEFDPPWL